MSAPASSSCGSGRWSPRASAVSVLVIDWTVIGASPPTSTEPTRIWRDLRRSMSRQGRIGLWVIGLADRVAFSGRGDHNASAAAKSPRLAARADASATAGRRARLEGAGDHLRHLLDRGVALGDRSGVERHVLGRARAAAERAAQRRRRTGRRPSRNCPPRSAARRRPRAANRSRRSRGSARRSPSFGEVDPHPGGALGDDGERPGAAADGPAAPPRRRRQRRVGRGDRRPSPARRPPRPAGARGRGERDRHGRDRAGDRPVAGHEDRHLELLLAVKLGQRGRRHRRASSVKPVSARSGVSGAGGGVTSASACGRSSTGANCTRWMFCSTVQPP